MLLPEGHTPEKGGRARNSWPLLGLVPFLFLLGWAAVGMKLHLGTYSLETGTARWDPANGTKKSDFIMPCVYHPYHLNDEITRLELWVGDFSYYVVYTHEVIRP